MFAVVGLLHPTTLKSLSRRLTQIPSYILIWAYKFGSNCDSSQTKCLIYIIKHSVTTRDIVFFINTEPKELENRKLKFQNVTYHTKEDYRGFFYQNCSLYCPQQSKFWGKTPTTLAVLFIGLFWPENFSKLLRKLMFGPNLKKIGQKLRPVQDR